jgi:transcriptional regulator with XRE-family HTH domain
LEAKLPPDARRRAARRADAIIAAVTLRELREECAELTQAQVADDLGVSQSAISQLEQRGDTMLSTLADFVSALGGELEIRANFPGGRTFKIARYH